MAAFHGRAVGLKTHIWANNTRSAILLAGFPVLLVMILYGVQLVLMGLGVLPGTGRGLDADMARAAEWLSWTVPMAAVIAVIWFVIAVVLLRKKKMNPILVMVLCGVFETICVLVMKWI